MSAIRLDDDADSAAEFFVAFFHDGRVFGHGYSLVGTAADVQQWYAGLGQRLELIDGAALECGQIIGRYFVCLLAKLPIAGAAASGA